MLTDEDNAALDYAIAAQYQGLLELLEAIGGGVMKISPQELIDGCARHSADLGARMEDHLNHDRRRKIRP